ncbi:ABC transporter substrate-binding protein [Phenylobacterium sp.]|uniref:ABC transporter substrate-binding protein n=1 Tax=Phenylobacterium sp. TaxID=1871053 RepID=UPI0025CE057B|nr:ABC transporter substrate-binding protein [Phenylobacterium sp.]
MRFDRPIVAILAAALLPGGAAVAAPAGRPERIMSINLCTDLLLLQLVPRARIASVSFLARDGAGGLFPGLEAGIPTNHGTPEDIVNMQPDLILAADVSTPVARALARRVGARVVEVKSANSFADIRQNLREVGAVVGEPARAEALVQRMDATLGQLAAQPPRRRARVVAWSGGPAVPGRDTLANAIIDAAGAINVAAQPGRNYTTFGVEELLEADPDALLYGRSPSQGPSLEGGEGQHRVVRRLYATRRISFDEVASTCGLPQSADAARDLRRALDALPPRGPGR